MPQLASPEGMLSTSQAAEVLGVTTARVRQLALEGLLYQTELGPRVRVYRREDVENLAAARAVGADWRQRAIERGAGQRSAEVLAQVAERGERHRQRRARDSEAKKRLKKRVREARKELDELNREREELLALHAAELSAIDLKREATAAFLERSGEDLAPLPSAPRPENDEAPPT